MAVSLNWNLTVDVLAQTRIRGQEQRVRFFKRQLVMRTVVSTDARCTLVWSFEKTVSGLYSVLATFLLNQHMLNLPMDPD